MRRCMRVRRQLVVRTTEGDTKAFDVKVGLHQRSVLSPLLFVTVTEIIIIGQRAGLPLKLLYGDNSILIARSESMLCKGYKGCKTKV